MSLPGIVLWRKISIDDPLVGKSPLFKVILDQTIWAFNVSKILPSEVKKSFISLAGKLPSSISVFS